MQENVSKEDKNKENEIKKGKMTIISLWLSNSNILNKLQNFSHNSMK